MLILIGELNGQKIKIPVTADTGAGAPVGSFIYMYKKSSPSGYLYCDGSTFDETKYPALYQYLGSNVLPDYRECVAVGAEQNATDTIASHDVYTEGQFKDDQLQNHEHGLTLIGINDSASALKGIANYSTTNGNTSPAQSVSGGAYGDIRFGTTTHGKRKAVYFYIKATSGLTENQQENVLNTINENLSYSTTEHKTGKKWIDGKPIYRIVTTATKNQQVDTTTYKDTGAPLPSNVDKYILIRSTQNTANAFYYSTTNATLYIAAVITMNAFSGTNYILEYTKTV